MTKYKNMLTIENLATLGILDDTLDLYHHLCDVVDNAYFKATATRPNKTIYPNEFDKLCKKPLNAFFESHAGVFSKYPMLYINDQNLAEFSMFNCPKTGPLTFSPKQISFLQFVQQLQEVATKAVYRRVCKERPNVSYNQISASVSSYIFELAEEERSKQEIILSPSSNPSELIKKNITVWVYGNANCISCAKDDHSIQNRTLLVPLLAENHFVLLPVRYCLDCKRYFVSVQTVTAFEDKYGKMLLRTFQESNSKDDFSKFASESELHSWGYNVVAGQMSESTRHQIIITLINYNLMKQECICRDLENAIRIFKDNSRMSAAVQKWENDLVFTQELSSTPAVGIGMLKQK